MSNVAQVNKRKPSFGPEMVSPIYASFTKPDAENCYPERKLVSL